MPDRRRRSLDDWLRLAFVVAVAVLGLGFLGAVVVAFWRLALM